MKNFSRGFYQKAYDAYREGGRTHEDFVRANNIGETVARQLLEHHQQQHQKAMATTQTKAALTRAQAFA
jgi:hypothetical protein